MSCSYWIVLCLSLVAHSESRLHNAMRWLDEAAKNAAQTNAAQTARTRRLERMQQRAAMARIILNRDSESIEAQLAPTPIMRYDDQPRRCIDATLWLWTDSAELPHRVYGALLQVQT